MTEVEESALDGARRLVSDIEHPLDVQAKVLGPHLPGTAEPDADLPGDRFGADQWASDHWVGLRVESLGAQGRLELPQRTIDASAVAHELAKLVHEEILAATGRIWPATDNSAARPLVPAETGWAHPDTGELAVPYGQVRSAPERGPLPGGTVRWWLDPLDSGVIASDQGDLVFTYFDLRPDAQGLRHVPAPGQAVAYQVRDGTRGVYRLATDVFPTAGTRG